MQTLQRHARTGTWIALILCAALFVTGLAGLILHDPPGNVRSVAPGWLPLVAAVVAATGFVVSLVSGSQRRGVLNVLSWSGLLLLLWTVGGLPLDFLRVVSLAFPGLMPPGVDWVGLATRLSAFGVLLLLARLAFARPTVPVRESAAFWYGYAALALALPYPILKTLWALGASFGLRWPGADGLAGSFALWLPAVPWLLAAALSVLLVRKPRWMPRRLVLVAGWSATAIVATFGPAACWSLLVGLIKGDVDFGGMAGWVYCLIYGSWFLWAVAACAATRSYQLRTAHID